MTPIIDLARRAFALLARLVRPAPALAPAGGSLLALSPDDALSVGDEEYVVYSARGFRAEAADVREYGLARRGEPAARLLVPVGAPDRAFLVLDEAAGHPRPAPIPASAIVVRGRGDDPP
ncbi:MAG TPA: hypothetical protein VHF22_04455 [Planctomycetota bacterium]|nr:hypothetical protein [Planctomycetota bacterium]